MKYITTLIILFSSIFSFSQNLTPTDDVAIITVKVQNYKGIPSIGDKVTFKSKKDGKVYTGESKANGEFQILLPEGQDYSVLIMGFEMDNTNNVFSVPNKPGIIKGNYLIRYELPKEYTLKNLYFDTAKATIRPESYKTLAVLAELMKRKRNMVILLEGHTDSQGDDFANQKLSEARALSVKSFLTKSGVQSVRVQTAGYGESRPIASNNTPEGRQKNRRTEVRVLNQ